MATTTKRTKAKTLKYPKVQSDKHVVGNLEFALSELPENSIVMSMVAGNGNCKLGSFKMASVMQNGILLYEFDDIKGKRRVFYIAIREMVEGIINYVESEA